ncbi:MAG: family 16 glycosylhydrolase, partial [Niabella sp.]
DTPDGLYHPHFNYHWAENGVHKQMGWKWYGTSGVDYGNDWHTYGLLWKQGFLQVFIDGEAGPFYQAPNVTSEEMYIVLNAAIKKNAAPANGQMLVDYVKVWKR